ncbi:hypothetical protein CBM2633_A50178 [Cupriavidus taiwanensis]|nr:hypothetical protein CBM2604_A50439 [Cupriavidus taiwanensis]SOZ27876.1 hypothetical protein CBM2609_A60439 [Cupriavidus taiwanensis]SOZ46168.1 hypothetical protein CBM2610_A70436 [Cupriavidus taiwanensis]SPA14292.1 hypothetical protein CBM2633_A50178 [Cupriavidus taiwanensis]
MHVEINLTGLHLNCTYGGLVWPLVTLIDLGFAICELRKALIYKASWLVTKTPKAVLAKLCG